MKNPKTKKPLKEYEEQPETKKRQMHLQEEAQHAIGPKRLKIEKKIKKV